MDHDSLHFHIKALRNAALDTHPKITLQQLEFLFVIYRARTLTHAETAHVMGMSPGGISRMVDVFGDGKKKGRSKSLGLVTTEKDSQDDRIKHILMTVKGDLFVERYFSTINLSQSIINAD